MEMRHKRWWITAVVILIVILVVLTCVIFRNMLVAKIRDLIVYIGPGGLHTEGGLGP